MCDLRDHDGITREQIIIAMARLLSNTDLDNTIWRIEAYVRNGFYDRDIIEHDDEAVRRERLRRKLFAKEHSKTEAA